MPLRSQPLSLKFLFSSVEPQATTMSLFQVRLALVGRKLEPKEIAFTALGRSAELAGVAMRAYGPVASSELATLAESASLATTTRGYPPDTFVIVAGGRVRLMALVPEKLAEHETNKERLFSVLGIA